MSTDYIKINKNLWNARLQSHLESDFYDMNGFLEGRSSLNPIELELLGDVKGKSILHLQCHFGQDSLSLSRMGAKVTGVDLSDKAINKAKELAEDQNLDAHFICCDVYDLESHLDEKFDIVFTSYGTIGWLPDLNQWAQLISKYLKPGGQFIFVEFHPVIWMYDNDFSEVRYNYFKAEPIIEDEEGTYADRNAAISKRSVTWNHGLSEVVTSLIENGLQITVFREYDYSPYNCFANTFEPEPNKFRIKTFGNNVPMVYSIKAIKK